MAPTPRGCQRRSFVPLSGFGGGAWQPSFGLCCSGGVGRGLCWGPCVHASCGANRDQRVPESLGCSWCTGPRGDPQEVALCVPPPPPLPPVGRHPNKPLSMPRRDEPRPWLQSPPAAQPVSPAQGAGAGTARGGPPRPVPLHEAPAPCARLVRACPLHLSLNLFLHLSLRVSLRPSPHLSPVHLSKVRPRVRPCTHLQRRPSTCPAPPRPRSASAQSPTRGRLPRGRSAVSRTRPHLCRRRCDSQLRHLRPPLPAPELGAPQNPAQIIKERSTDGRGRLHHPRPQFPFLCLAPLSSGVALKITRSRTELGSVLTLDISSIP